MNLLYNGADWTSCMSAVASTFDSSSSCRGERRYFLLGFILILSHRYLFWANQIIFNEKVLNAANTRRVTFADIICLFCIHLCSVSTLSLLVAPDFIQAILGVL